MQELKVEYERLLEEGKEETAELVKRMGETLDRAEDDPQWHVRVKEQNEALMAEHGLTLSVLSARRFSGARFTIVEMRGEPREFSMSEAVKEAQPSIEDLFKEAVKGAVYTVEKTEAMFGRDGYAITIAARGEVVAVVKGEDRAHLLVSILEQVVSMGAVREWTEIYEEELKEAGDAKAAAYETDKKFAERFGS